jgi:hypothetical protein
MRGFDLDINPGVYLKNDKKPLMRITIFVLTLLFYSTSYSQLKKLNAETTIQQVTLFSSGARVTRSAAVSLQPGRTEISFAGLSNQLDQQTVQLKADANIVLLSVQSTKDYLSVRKIEQEERNLIEQSNALKDKSDLDTKLLEVYKNEEAMLIKNQAIGGQSGVKAIELKESLDLQRQRLTEVYGKELDIQKRILADQQGFEKTNLQLAEISKKRDSVSYIVSALVEAKENRTVNFQLLYNVKDAGWYPTYDVRVDEVTEPLNVLMNANVFQRSGETWKNISLFLSTGNPKDNATPSKIQPWLLGFYDPYMPLRGQGPQGTVTGRITDRQGQPVAGATLNIRGSKTATLTDANGFFKFNNISANGSVVITSVGYLSREIMLQPGYITAELEASTTSLSEVVVVGFGVSDFSGSASGIMDSNLKKEKRIQTVSVVTQFQPTTMIYKIDDRYTLETDGKTTTIGITAFDMPALYDYVTTPKIDPSAFLTARIINWQDYNLQSGEVSLYFEGTYLGKTYIDLGSVADTLSLSLGKDNGIKVSRKLVKEYSTRKFIGSNRTETREYEISVRNTKHVPVNINVLDQYPVSTTKEISVDDVKAPEAQIDKETGITSWIISLAPGQEKKLKMSYNVKYPRDRKVVLE